MWWLAVQRLGAVVGDSEIYRSGSNMVAERGDEPRDEDSADLRQDLARSDNHA